MPQDKTDLKHFCVQSDLKGVTHSNLKHYVPITGLELAGDLDDDCMIWFSTRLYDVWFAMARNVFTMFGVACIATSKGCERRVYVHATSIRSIALDTVSLRTAIGMNRGFSSD